MSRRGDDGLDGYSGEAPPAPEPESEERRLHRLAGELATHPELRAATEALVRAALVAARKLDRTALVLEIAELAAKILLDAAIYRVRSTQPKRGG